MYSINFTVAKNKFCLRFHYNGANSYLFVNGKEIVKFNAKNFEISPLCLGNISKEWSADNMEKTGLNGYVYEFNIDYGDINVSSPPMSVIEYLSFLHKYFLEKYKI